MQTVRRYMQITAGDPMIHKSVARAVNGLREFLEVERKGIPGEIILEAYRLESQLFNGYDPKFDGMNLRASDHLCSRNSLKRISLYMLTTQGLEPVTPLNSSSISIFATIGRIRCPRLRPPLDSASAGTRWSRPSGRAEWEKSGNDVTR